jgi:hypothetical protein
MTGKDYFILGCKLFGIYCLVLAIPAILAVIPAFTSVPGSNEDTRQIMRVVAIATSILPVLYISSGFYLIRGGDRLYQFAYPNETTNTNISEEKLLLFVKMLGLFLIIGNVPELLRSLSYYITQRIQPMYNLLTEQQFTYLNAAANIWGVIVGIYMLKGGRFIAKVALKTFPHSQHED